MLILNLSKKTVIFNYNLNRDKNEFNINIGLSFDQTIDALTQEFKQQIV